MLHNKKISTVVAFVTMIFGLAFSAGQEHDQPMNQPRTTINHHFSNQELQNQITECPHKILALSFQITHENVEAIMAGLRMNAQLQEDNLKIQVLELPISQMPSMLEIRFGDLSQDTGVQLVNIRIP